ncbi:MAG TPA: carbohydrate-binding protein [Thermoanaerobaculia bacterium]|nr:carbohydrate-binding protein [Thermoanaerobaculia bacterium]
MAWIEDLTYEATDVNYSCTASPSDSTPYGLPFAIPGTIMAGDFDNGGEGVAYHEGTPVVEPGYESSYRTSEVDLYDNVVMRLTEGEWMQYTVDVETAGAYTLVAEVGSEGPGGLFHVELDGVDVTGPLVVPDTMGWIFWASPTKPAVSFPAGRHVLRFVVDAGFESFRSLRFVVAQAPFGGTPPTLPGTIYSTNFDEGGEQIAYHDTSSGCSGSCERMVDVDYYSPWIYETAPGEWLEYTVNVTTAGIYTLIFEVAAEQGGGTFHLELDGADVTGPLTMPTTNDWITFQNVTRTGVSLPAGQHVLRLVMDAAPAGGYHLGTFHTITVQP